jgi:hypothetical protein
VDSIIAVRVRLDSGVDRYFLTWGDLGSNRCWPGDVERAALRASVGFALGGTPVGARVCDTLQAASGERYFYECLVAMQQQIPAATRKKFTAWDAAGLLPAARIMRPVTVRVVVLSPPVSTGELHSLFLVGLVASARHDAHTHLVYRLASPAAHSRCRC